MLRRLEQQFSRTRSRTATNATSPTSKPQHQPRTPRTPGSAAPPAFSTSSEPSTSEQLTRSADYTDGSATSALTSRASLPSFRDSLPENPKIYEFSEISAATNKFLSKRATASSASVSSTPSWKCNLRGKDAIVFQRKLHHPTTRSAIRSKLSQICKLHHAAVIKLLGAAISGDSIYLVYEFVSGSNLADCLRPKNPSYTVLGTWMSRMQVAVDIADGLDYIHNNTGLELRLVQNHIKSSSIIVTEPSQSARICHFGTAELCSEPIERSAMESMEIGSEMEPRMVRSRSVKFRGTPGYMAPEFMLTGIGTQKSDVYAFGVVMLELISGDKPIRYEYDGQTGEYVTISLIESARSALNDDNVVDGGVGEGRLRRWVDSRLKDSFPVDVAERMTRLALDCVHVEAERRPDMRRVASKISGLYLRSMKWAENLKVPVDFTASFAPR
ncbi:LysM domain receptor-like kinase 3-like protein [Drosera capensis]